MSAKRLKRGKSYFICADKGDPVELNLASGDVLFAANWTAEMAAAWREKTLTPGPEWPATQLTEER